MSFELSTPDERTAVVSVAGELDLGNVDQLAAAVDPVVERGLERLVVEVHGLRFADSSAIALLVQWSTRVGEVELRDPPPLLRRVITTMGLTQRLQLKP
jgi:stage II sporulation protein AA (anti-sigma F factor antagonist)